MGVKSKAQSVKAILQTALGILANWIGEGPWRSKSVLGALAVAALGLGFWFSGIQNAPPQNEANRVVTNAPAINPADTTTPPAERHWDWSKSFPFYVRLAASYVAGFCLGWFFRKLKRLVVVAVALVIALLALGKFAGCDTTQTQERVKRSSEWMQQEVTSAENQVKNMLPSAGAGGIGVCLGFRRRSKAAAPEKPAD
jgi:uncharacterized membrane protein (Fun14 family)